MSARREQPVRYVDRETGRVEIEPVVAERYLRWLYGPRLLARTVRHLLRRRWVSRLYGWWQDRPASRRRIPALIREAGIDVEEAACPPESYPSLNAFFSRRLKPGARTLDPDPEVLISPADARVFAWQTWKNEHIPIKGGRCSLPALIGDHAFTEQLTGGAVFVLRLAPGDYHRFHFPASGEAEAAERLAGFYDSVNPIALARDPALLCRNERQRTPIATERFGTLCMVEVGALFVGRIVQTYRPGPVERGDEKGYFQFGGSTIVLLCPPGVLQVDQDLLEHTAAGLETRLRMGVSLGRRLR